MFNTFEPITFIFFFILIKLHIISIWLTEKSILGISQGTKISATRFDWTKIQPVLKLIRLRYINHSG